MRDLQPQQAETDLSGDARRHHLLGHLDRRLRQQHLPDRFLHQRPDVGRLHPHHLERDLAGARQTPAGDDAEHRLALERLARPGPRHLDDLGHQRAPACRCRRRRLRQRPGELQRHHRRDGCANFADLPAGNYTRDPDGPGPGRQRRQSARRSIRPGRRPERDQHGSAANTTRRERSSRTSNTASAAATNSKPRSRLDRVFHRGTGRAHRPSSAAAAPRHRQSKPARSFPSPPTTRSTPAAAPKTTRTRPATRWRRERVPLRAWGSRPGPALSKEPSNCRRSTSGDKEPAPAVNGKSENHRHLLLFAGIHDDDLGDRHPPRLGLPWGVYSVCAQYTSGSTTCASRSRQRDRAEPRRRHLKRNQFRLGNLERGLSMSRLASLRKDERGTTIVEVLVSTATGLVVLSALTHGDPRHDARQRPGQRPGRRNPACAARVTKIMQQLHSACVAPKIAPIQPGSTGTSLRFIHAPIRAPPWRRLPTITQIGLVGDTLTQTDCPRPGAATRTGPTRAPPTTKTLLTGSGRSPPAARSSATTPPPADRSRRPPGHPLQVTATPLTIQVASPSTPSPPAATAPWPTPAPRPASSSSATLRLTPPSFNEAAPALPCQ